MSVAIHAQLEGHKTKLLAQITAAAKAADTDSLLSLNEELRQTTSLLKRIESTAAEVDAFLRLPRGGKMVAPSQRNGPVKVAGRAHGADIRAAFLKKADTAGFLLRPFRGAIYSGPSGRRVGIGVATERKPNRWFLGLGEDAFDSAVLLCATNAGKTIEICLPRSVFAQHGRYLSRSGGQVKFNVARRDAHLILKVPGRSPVTVDQYVGALAGVDL